jgi:hypothetical protein
MDAALGQRLIDLQERIVSHFDSRNWEEIGLLTDSSAMLNSHSRRLRSLSFGDDDHTGNVLTPLRISLNTITSEIIGLPWDNFDVHEISRAEFEGLRSQ